MLTYRMTGAYAAIRRQFNTPIGSFEGVEESLARMAGLTFMLQATRLFTAGAVSEDKHPGVATAIAKYHMTEMSRKIINDAMDIHGGRGIMMGPLNYLGRAYQSIPVSITVEGANILTRSLMIFGQGAIRCHPYAQAEMKAAENDDSIAFDRLLLSHMGYFISNKVRCFTFALLGFYKSKRYLWQLNWMSAGLAVCADVAMLFLGGDLKRKERLSARLGDVLSQLYLASAVLKYDQDLGHHPSEKKMLDWCLQTLLYQAQEAFYGFFQNFPLRPIGYVLKFVIFPYGRIFSKPNDKLEHSLAKNMLSPSTREWLTSLCYIGKNNDDPTGIMESAFHQLKEVEPLILKIQQAIKKKELNKRHSFSQHIQEAFQKNMINNEEMKALIAFEEIRKK